MQNVGHLNFKLEILYLYDFKKKYGILFNFLKPFPYIKYSK